VEARVEKAVRTRLRTLTIVTLVLAAGSMAGCQALQRKFLFFPSHDAADNGFTRWVLDDRVIGYARPVADPDNVWLMLHGNGGQASGRGYALPAFSPRDALYVLEYPGYGAREGRPSRQNFDSAAREGYAALRAQFPGKRVGIVGESLGSGPAAMLSRETPAPDMIVFIVPFDTLKSVAAEHFPRWLVSVVLAGSWNNVEAMSGYRGPVAIFGAENDEVIAVGHARALAAAIPQAQFHLIPGGHGWALRPGVEIRFP
jgi:pimeloyl-ACP methyl ester carboxylesterase